jgi:hypothetical protein
LAAGATICSVAGVVGRLFEPPEHATARRHANTPAVAERLQPRDASRLTRAPFEEWSCERGHGSVLVAVFIRAAHPGGGVLGLIERTWTEVAP